MKILVLGSFGMAGHMITTYLTNTEKYDVFTLSRYFDSDYILDIEDKENTIEFFKTHRDFDYIINCIGVLAPDQYKNISRTVYVNSYFPKLLEQSYLESETRIIHISTDCIFDGKIGNYVELDTPTETNIYGRSKALGEINNNKDLTIRTSIVGTEITNGSGLLHWFLTNKDKTCHGYSNAYWNGITTLEMAKAIESYIDTKCSLSGIYHLIPPGNIDKASLLRLFNYVFDTDKTILNKELDTPIDKTLVDTRKCFPYKPKLYLDQLVELKEFGEKHKLLKNYS